MPLATPSHGLRTKPRSRAHRASNTIATVPARRLATPAPEQGDPARTWPDGGWLRGCHTRDRASNGTARWVICARPTASPTPGEAAIDAWDGCYHDALSSRKHLRKHLHRCSSLLLGGGRESCVGMHPVRRRRWWKCFPLGSNSRSAAPRSVLCRSGDYHRQLPSDASWSWRVGTTLAASTPVTDKVTRSRSL